jgi:hypothetical protein
MGAAEGIDPGRSHGERGDIRREDWGRAGKGCQKNQYPTGKALHNTLLKKSSLEIHGI